MSRLAPSMKKIWLGPREVYPIIACMVGAIGWTTYMSGRSLFANPDVIANRVERQSPLRDSATLETRGHNWVAPQLKYLPKDPSQIRIFSGYERKYD